MNMNKAKIDKILYLFTIFSIPVFIWLELKSIGRLNWFWVLTGIFLFLAMWILKEANKNGLAN